MSQRKLLAIGLSYKSLEETSPLSGHTDAWKVIKEFHDDQRYNDFKLLTDDWEAIKEMDNWMELVSEPSDDEQAGENGENRNQYGGIIFPGNARKQNILDGIEWLVEDAEDGDELFFYFAGHGLQQEDTGSLKGDDDDDERLEDDHQDECIVAIDGEILDDELYAKMVENLKKGVRLIAVIDACHSGTILDLAYVEKEGELEEVTNPRKDSEADVVLISGSKDDQTSGEIAGRGLLTDGFLKTCREKLHSWEENPINYLDFLNELRFHVKLGSGEHQTVQLSSNKWFELTDPFPSLEKPVTMEDLEGSEED